MANRPDYLEALFGIWYAGLVAVPVNAKLHPREVEYILGNSGARLCITDEGHAEGIENVCTPKCRSSRRHSSQDRTSTASC